LGMRPVHGDDFTWVRQFDAKGRFRRGGQAFLSIRM
jgi:hypothetical protein